MIYLFTGTPGSSKTLNAIEFVNESDIFKNRPVYYFNIEGLTLDWSRLSEDEAKKWFDLPDGAVIVFDEVQRIMPLRKAGAIVPEWVQKLDTHRHSGFDIVMITQHPMLLDTFARRMVGQHTHIMRQFGMESARHYSWQKCQGDPEEFHTKKEAIVQRKKFNRKYYGVYKSAEVHTHKRKLPLKLFLPFLLLVPVSYALYSVLSSYATGDASALNVAEHSVSDSSGRFFGGAVSSDPVVTLKQYVDMNTPRITDVPWSAPLYDSVTEVKSYPRPQCFVWESGVKKGRCTCMTQQASALSISDAACLRYVRDRYFNPFISDRAISEDSEPRVRSSVASGDRVDSLPSRSSRPPSFLINYDHVPHSYTGG